MSHTTNAASPFSTFADTPFLIKNEGETIVVKFNRTGPTTGTVTWTSPINQSGCDTANPLSYNGVVITIDTTPIDPVKFPLNGSRYVGDPTANVDTHAGDKLDTALVIAALYDDIDTRSIDVYDLDPTTAYYISLHAVDAQYRYHVSGVHSYSLDFGNKPGLGKPGYQIIVVGEDGVGVLSTDPTGLDPTKTYTVPTNVNFEAYDIVMEGANIQTYGELITEWNIQAALLTNPLESVTPPNINSLYLDKKNYQLFQWTGTQEILLDNLYTGTFDPSQLVDGVLSYNNDNGMVYEYNTGVWVPQLTYHTDFQPNDPTCGFIWYDGTTAYSWIGVWSERTTYASSTNPSDPIPIDCVTYWYNPDEGSLSKYDPKCGKWEDSLAIVYPTDPTILVDGDLWMDEKNLKLNTLQTGTWVNDKVVKTTQTETASGEYYFNTETGELFLNTAGTFTPVLAVVWYQDPLNLKSGTLWWDDTNSLLYMRERLSNSWILQQLVISTTDPRYRVLEVGDVWIDGDKAYVWDGGEFVAVKMVYAPLPIDQYTDDLFWVKPDSTIWALISSVWTQVSYIDYSESLFNFNDGDYWFNPSTNELFLYNAGSFTLTPYSNKSLKPATGYTYFNTSSNTLQTWNGYQWVEGSALFRAYLNSKGYIQLETEKVGSGAVVQVDYYHYGADGYYPVGGISELFTDMDPDGRPQKAVEGSDPQTAKPTYMEMGIGTDGTDDERREMIDSIKHQLGYPQVEVELSKQQMDIAITNALEAFRQRSGMAYSHGFMFLDIQPTVQNYHMTNKRLNHHKIVSINKMYRVSSSFLSVAQGQGVYGQMALQQMYQMGSFDLVSYHLVGSYVETMNELFASEIVFKFNADNRMLSIFKSFFKPERVLMEVSMERTEQDILKDRYLRQWIQGYAKCQCMLMLAQIRGKYGSLPGAGGGVSLNAADLSARADMEMMQLMQDIDDYVVNNPENYSGSVVILA